MRDHRRDVDLSALPPDKAEVVRAFAATLQQVCEEETEKLLLSLYGFELFRDGIAALRAEQMSPDSPFWREVEERTGAQSKYR